MPQNEPRKHTPLEAELLSALKAIMKRIEDGDLVRDISKDHHSDWAMKMMYFVKELQEAQTAIAKAEGAA